MSIVLFNVLPSMVDILAACSYLAGRMEPWVALIVLVRGGEARPAAMWRPNPLSALP